MKNVTSFLTSVCNHREFWPHFFFIFFALLLLLLPVYWDANEENYFQLSWQTVEPEAFPENHAIFDASKGRLVPEFLIGNAVKFLGYDAAHVFIRLLCILGYAIALGYLFSWFRFRIIDGAIVLGLFVLGGQQLFGGAWLFNGAESKVFAYIFVILALLDNFRERHYRALLWLAAATWMHFLVGLFWTIFIYTCTLYFQRDLKKLSIYAVFYTLLMSPLLVLLVPELLVKVDSSYVLSADYIYSRIRNPHHVDPFQSTQVFLEQWAPGVVKLLLIMAFALYVFLKDKENKLAILVLVAGSFLLLFLLLAFFDRNSLFFGKFYLFRPTGLVLFFGLMLFVMTFRKLEHQRLYPLYVCAAIVVLSAAVIPRAVNNFHLLITPEQRYVTSELIESIQHNSDKNDIVLTDPAQKWDAKAIQMVRDLPRPTLVEWKFVPTQKQDILHWYTLMQFKEEVFAKGCSANNQNIHHLIVFDEARMAPFKDCSTVHYQDSNLIYLELHPARKKKPGEFAGLTRMNSEEVHEKLISD